MSEHSVLDRQYKRSAVPSAKPEPEEQVQKPTVPTAELQFETVFDDIPAFHWDQVIIEDEKERLYKPKVYFTNGSCYKG